jgi:murein DD-endopeptidase MepM/ murein hydrolase activator NlpD
MLLKIFYIVVLSTSLSWAQFNDKSADSTFKIEDYWEVELAPLSDLNQVVSYIHNDPFNYLFIENIPGGNPLERDIAVNSHYGARKHPVHKVLKFHRGIDLAGKNGEFVVASGKGVVIDTGFQADLGNYVKVKHKYGFESIYGHLSKITVKKGQEVLKDMRIGKVGSTGKVTGPHLHYTLKKNGEYLDPFDFLFMKFESEHH